jgi:hypothetical protein
MCHLFVNFKGLRKIQVVVPVVLALFFCISDSEFFHIFSIFHECRDTPVGWAWDQTSC